jgi:hypothetical protein
MNHHPQSDLSVNMQFHELFQRGMIILQFDELSMDRNAFCVSFLHLGPFSRRHTVPIDTGSSVKRGIAVRRPVARNQGGSWTLHGNYVTKNVKPELFFLLIHRPNNDCFPRRMVFTNWDHEKSVYHFLTDVIQQRA